MSNQTNELNRMHPSEPRQRIRTNNYHYYHFTDILLYCHWRLPTYWYQKTSIFAKCSFTYIWIGCDAFLALKAISHKRSCITTDNCKKKKYDQTGPACFFHCVRSWKKPNSSHYINSWPKQFDKSKSAQKNNRICTT